MKREQLNLTEEDGYDALRGHVAERAHLAREKYGPEVDSDAIRRMLADPEVMRFPTVLMFDEDLLIEGEFAWARPLGDRPSDGFALVVHPSFEERPDVLPLLIAYHIVSINYLDVVTHVEAELFGATLLGLETDDYYSRLCALADELPGAEEHAARRALVAQAEAQEVFADAQPSSGCGSSCGCGAG